MNVVESLQWRYACKKFNDTKQLSLKQINTIKESFNLTATSYGLQTLKMVVISNKKTQEQLQEHSFNQQQISQASHVLVICIPKEFNQTHIEEYFKLVKQVRNTPDDVLNPFKDYLKSDVAKKTDEQIYNWNRNQAYIALGNLLTVCAIEKIDSCPMEGFISEKYDDVLGLEKYNLTSVLLMPIGFRDEDDYIKDLKKVRKGVENVVIDIK